MRDVPLALLTDVFTFLAFLHAEDIAPMRLRFLAPSALANLDAQLRVPDGIVFTPRRAGKRGATERETERIRFIHFLCEAAELVALTGRFLKPTPRAAHWLTRSTFDRAAELFAALCNNSHRVQDLWRIYRRAHLKVGGVGRLETAATTTRSRPASAKFSLRRQAWRGGCSDFQSPVPPPPTCKCALYRLPASPATLVMLLDLLRAIPRDDPIHLTTLHKLIALPMLDDVRDASSETIWRDLLRYLEWFGVIQNDGATAPTLRLTAWGACLLRRTDAPTLPVEPPPQPLELRELTFHIPPYAHLPTLYELADYATPLPCQRRGRGWDDRVSH